MTSLVLVEPGDELSLQALGVRARRSATSRAVARRRVATRPRPGREAIARARPSGADAIVAAGSERGNEVLAHVAARLDLPFAANVHRGSRATS